MKKYIIGLGCSWTQGEGGYPDEIWKQYNGRVHLDLKDDYHLRKYEHENSWVNVLCRDYFADYTPMNLGVRGIGNRAAVEQLHFCDKIDWGNSTGIVVMLMPGFTRQDVFVRDSKTKNPKLPDGYSDMEYRHYKWVQAYPSATPNTQEELHNVIADNLLSDDFLATVQMLTLLDLENFCKAKGFKLVLANPYNVHIEGTDNYLLNKTGLAKKFDWSVYLHRKTNYVSLAQKLMSLEHDVKNDNWHDYFEYYYKKPSPAKYLTNCPGSHPTIEGYKVIAEELANFIKMMGYV